MRVVSKTIDRCHLDPGRRMLYLGLYLGVLLLTALCLHFTAPEAVGHEGQIHGTGVHQQAGPANLVRLDVPDLVVTNQDGKKGRLVSDFIGRRTVAITFAYTSCTTICPIIDGIFRNLQNRLGPDLGKDFALLTLTIDAATDIPERLKDHTKKIGLKPGWDYLTGDRASVNRILKALEVFTPDIDNHPPVVFVVDGSKSAWYRLNGFSSPAQIEQAMRRQLAAN